MINSLCGSMGSLKSEVGSFKNENEMVSLRRDNSYTKLQPTSPNESVSESRKTPTPPSSDFDNNNSLVPPSLKFEADEDVEIQSPDRSLWEFFAADQLEGDFMISSPVRNVASPTSQASCYQNSSSNYNFNYPAMHGLSMMGCSPPRMSSPLGPYKDKGKGLSPLHRVFNSPNNQYMQVESLSLPALEFLDDLEKDDDFGSYTNTNKASDVGISSTDCFDLSTVPELLECLTMPNTAASSRFCGSMSETGGLPQLTQDNDNIYQLSSSGESAPLLQQLQQERQQEKEHHHHHQQTSISQRTKPQQQVQNMSSSLMVPLSLGPEQVRESLDLTF